MEKDVGLEKFFILCNFKIFFILISTLLWAFTELHSIVFIDWLYSKQVAFTFPEIQTFCVEKSATMNLNSVLKF